MKKFFSFCTAAIFVLILAFFVACTPQEAGDEENGGDDYALYGTNGGEQEPELPREPRTAWEPGNMTGPGATVATVNGREIGINDVNFRLQQADWQLSMDMDPMADFDPDNWDDAVREEAVRLAAVASLFRQYADENGIELTEFDMESVGFRVMDFLMNFDDEDEFVEMLEMDGIIGLSHLEYIFYVYEWVDKVIEFIIADPVLFAQYEQYMEELIGAKHILIGSTQEFVEFANFDGDEEAAYEFARDIWSRAIAGEDFDTLMTTYSEDPGLEIYPDGYTFSAGQMVPEFEDGTLSLEIGGISEPIQTDHGFHIIKRVPPNPEDYQTDPWSPPATEEELMGIAVYRAFEAKVAEADLVFLPELHTIPLN